MSGRIVILTAAQQLRAACRGLAPGTMFPTNGSDVNRAILICESCPQDVRRACLEEAMINNEDHGVWGGTSERERRRMRRTRKLERIAS